MRWRTLDALPRREAAPAKMLDAGPWHTTLERALVHARNLHDCGRAAYVEADDGTIYDYLGDKFFKLPLGLPSARSRSGSRCVGRRIVTEEG